MKANEAPEKIYLIRNLSTPTSLNTTNDCHEKYLQEWYKGREKDADIEYTRTDVFIEKACEWLNKEIPNTDLSPSSIIKFKVFNDECKKAFIEDFKKYMEGE